MKRPHRIAPIARSLVIAVLALSIGTWLAMPPGFMPALANGVPAIVICPGSDSAISAIEGPAIAMPGMHMDGPRHRHGQTAPFQQSCPYAVAVSLVAAGAAGPPPVLAVPVVAEPPPLTPTFPAFRRHATRDRPPAQGPPISA